MATMNLLPAAGVLRGHGDDPAGRMRLLSASEPAFSPSLAFRLTQTHIMKIRILSVTLMCAALTAAIGLRAEEKEPQTELGAKMEKMQSAYRTLNRNIDDASKNADSLAAIATIRENAQAALKLEPKKTDSVPADQKAKFVADYQAMIKKTISDLDAVEAALKAGNNAEAKTLLAAVKKDQGDGHKEFRTQKKS
jgi:cytochrome c556